MPAAAPNEPVAPLLLIIARAISKSRSDECKDPIPQFPRETDPNARLARCLRESLGLISSGTNGGAKNVHHPHKHNEQIVRTILPKNTEAEMSEDDEAPADPDHGETGLEGCFSVGFCVLLIDAAMEWQRVLQLPESSGIGSDHTHQGSSSSLYELQGRGARTPTWNQLHQAEGAWIKSCRLRLPAMSLKYLQL